MICQNEGCNTQPSWLRTRLLQQPGYYLESGWYCGDTCLRKGIVERLGDRKRPREKAFQSMLRLKLGHVLIESGALTHEQLQKAMAEQQKKPSERLGFHLVAMGFVRERDITLALSRQFGLPVVNLKNQMMNENVLRMVPLEIVRESKFFPLEYDSANNTLVLVTHDPADVSNMINLRSILNCDVTIYLSDYSTVCGMIEEFCNLAAGEKQSEEVAVDEVAEDLPGLAEFIVKRARVLNANSLNVKYFNRLIWTRFVVNRKPYDVIVNAA